jgi:hypothetical protein
LKIKQKTRTPAEVTREGFATLCDNLGMADAIRFVQFFDQGRGNYTVERAKLFEGETFPSLVEQIKKIRGKAARKH